MVARPAARRGRAALTLIRSAQFGKILKGLGITIESRVTGFSKN